VSQGATRGFDVAYTQSLQRVASDPLDLLANVNTVFGQASVTVALAAALALVAWRREPRLAWLAAGLFVVAAGAGVALKLLLVHAPPGPEYIRAWWNPLGVAISTPSGFPSGHVARVTFLAIFAMGLARPTALRIALLVVIAYTFWARVYIGDHWVSDAIGGLALGAATGSVALWWLARCHAYARSR
jgi:membrane-associated phospholipid phosphatase